MVVIWLLYTPGSKQKDTVLDTAKQLADKFYSIPDTQCNALVAPAGIRIIGTTKSDDNIVNC